ncbi:MAG: adenosine deaminase [Phototrophicales bacterium]|nr:MAG: adenosine deaminase [Phototrophicales bacterium]
MAFEVTDAVDRSSSLWQMLKDLPKIELHRHLEGSIRLTTLVDIATRYNIPLPSYETEFLRPYVQMTREDPATSAQFLTKFSVLRQLFVSEDVIQRIAYEAVEDAAIDNIHYMELRFTPYAQAKLMGFPIEQVVRWVCEAVQHAAQDNNIQVKLIVAVNRHESVEIAAEMLQAAIAHRDLGVVGFDLCGNEANYLAAPFAPLFQQAKDAGLGVTIHAGEWAGAENVRYAIEAIHPQRIGHGVRAVEDSTTLQMAIENNIYFEVCPTSNLQTGVVSQLDQHPLLDLYYLKAHVTINTDDPAIHNISLTDEYALLVQGLGLPLSYVRACILNAIHCAFLPQAQKDHLLAEIEPALSHLDPRVPETEY